MLIDKWLNSTSAICLLGVALLANAQTSQKCGDTRTVWKNATPNAKSVTATFKANCNEPQEGGEVSVYDGSGAKVLSFSILKASPAAIPSATITFPVPGNGHIDYICHPGHNDRADQCTSQILSVSDPSAPTP